MGGRYLKLTAIAGLALFLDQATKHLAVAYLKDKDPINIINGFLMLRFVENPGSAWSIFADKPASFRAPFFIGISLIGLALILYFYLKTSHKARIMGVALPLIFGGALGNLVDRLSMDLKVVDFIRVYYKGFSWPVFNVADMAITAGEILLVIAFFSGELPELLPGGTCEEKDGAGPQGVVDEESEPPASTGEDGKKG